MKMKVEKQCALIVEYEYDIEPGDVFMDPMKGWEVHVKAVIDARCAALIKVKAGLP